MIIYIDIEKYFLVYHHRHPNTLIREVYAVNNTGIKYKYRDKITGKELKSKNSWPYIKTGYYYTLGDPEEYKTEDFL